MKYIYNLSFLGILTVMCSACKTQVITPAIVPPVEIEAPQPAPTSHSLGIIGAVEPVYVLPMKAPFAGRIDTAPKLLPLTLPTSKPLSVTAKSGFPLQLSTAKPARSTVLKKNWPARRKLPASTSTKNVWSSIWMLSSAMK